MKQFLVGGEPLSPSDPRDYRRGMLLGFFLMLLGILFGILFGIMIVMGSITRSFGWGTIVLVVVGLLWVGMFVAAGFLLMHKGKLGLWIIYVLSALFVYWFCQAALRLLTSRGRDDVYGAIWSGLWLIVWLSIAKYFYNRRAQFTRWLDSTGPSQSEHE